MSIFSGCIVQLSEHRHRSPENVFKAREALSNMSSNNSNRSES
jgi:hypothetical protein